MPWNAIKQRRETQVPRTLALADQCKHSPRTVIVGRVCTTVSYNWEAVRNYLPRWRTRPPRGSGALTPGSSTGQQGDIYMVGLKIGISGRRSPSATQLQLKQ